MKRKKKTPLAKKKERLWELCKEITRARYGRVCYTCDAPTLYPHTGHFIAKSTCSTEVAYDLNNLRNQCFVCNIHKSGNWVEYEARLIRDHGEEYVKELKERNRRTKGLQYDILWWEKKVQEYEEILKQTKTPY